MLTKRFHLRTLMFLVALSAIGLWAGIAIWRFWASVLMLRSELSPVAFLAYIILALSLAAALTMIGLGLIVFVVRLRGVIRRESRPPNR